MFWVVDLKSRIFHSKITQCPWSLLKQIEISSPEASRSVCTLSLSLYYFFQGQLSLQKLWFYIQPCMRTMEILSSIAVTIDKVINLREVLLNGMLGFFVRVIEA